MTAADETINIFVSHASEDQMAFKVKRTTALEKVVVAYCSRKGLDRNEIRFLYDGDRFKPDATIESLDIEQDDRLLLLLHYHSHMFDCDNTTVSSEQHHIDKHMLVACYRRIEGFVQQVGGGGASDTKHVVF